MSNFPWGPSCAYDRTEIAHESWRRHPLIGHGLPPPKKRSDVRNQWRPSEAFRGLTGEPFVVRVFDTIPGKLITLDLNEGVPVLDCSLEWNWQPRAVKEFCRDLVVANLMTADLCAALCASMSTKGYRPKRDAVPRSAREYVLNKTAGRCVYCGTQLTKQHGLPNSYQPDHVLPVAKGGSDDVANLVPSCASCNSKKRDGTFEQFIAKMGGITS